MVSLVLSFKGNLAGTRPISTRPIASRRIAALNDTRGTKSCRRRARDWAEIDPSIFGTLFERGLDPDKRLQLGAHYTDRNTIVLIVEPVVVWPRLAEWADAKAKIERVYSGSTPSDAAGRRSGHAPSTPRRRSIAPFSTDRASRSLGPNSLLTVSLLVS
jgi:hypothetical protein